MRSFLPGTTFKFEPVPENARYSILIVDDNPGFLDGLSLFLSSRNFHVTTANTSVSGLEYGAHHKPDLVLTDFNMPDMDGLEFIRRFRTSPDEHLSKKMVIISYSALILPGDRERCLQAGANLYLTTPLNLEGLLEQIQELLPERQPHLTI
jgi:CheY-like chemotaxis protein